MSATVTKDSRPRADWSAPVFPSEAATLHRRYAIFGEGIARRVLARIGHASKAYIYDFDHSMTDGYVPYIGFVFKVPYGKVTIVFPQVADLNSRAVTIHSMGKVRVHDVIPIIDHFLELMPPHETGGTPPMAPE